MGLKEDIKKFAEDIGLDVAGFASAEPFLEEKKILEQKKEKGLLSPFEEQDIELRCYPERLLPGAKTIICFAMGYLIKPYRPEETGRRDEGDKSVLKHLHGRISRYAMVKDYHCVMIDKLKAVAEFISERKRGRFKFFVDTGALPDRAAARRAGIGWIGENTCLFTQELGSWVFLGEILTDIEFEPDKPAPDLCDHCGRCVKSCPTGALMAPFQINPQRCLSYITQMRSSIPEEFRRTMGNSIFGCDTCQEACPHNDSVRIPHHPEFVPDMPAITNLMELAAMGKGNFEKIFKPTAAGWRGRNVLRRNAICVLGNMVKGETDKEKIILLLKKLMDDPSEVIREQAEWSMARITGLI
ncbi:MAG TPA: tRNA epoxyqueuosine(34) reductase QueG [Thermoanaerobacterales bacterium]|nr:tRNA epoxyqueuosine(34) reductase QueG [Thermoanaerobacterales bacterium]